MEEPGTSPALPIALPGAGWRDWRWLGLLLLLAIGMRAWQIGHTEVPSRDSIGFIRLAWRLDRGDWREVIPKGEHHPGYPVALLAVSRALRAALGCDDPVRIMQLSAQLASALASVLLVVPMYYLGRELFDRRVGFWAALLLQCLPATGTLMADGLSEALFLLFVSTSLVLGLRGLRTGSGWAFALSGAAGGLAYLTRVEGSLVPFCIGVVLVLSQLRRAWRRPWGQCLKCASTLSAGALAVALPFVVLIGGVTVKPTAKAMLGKERHARLEEKVGPRAAPPSIGVAHGFPFAIWYYGPTIHPEDRYTWGLYALRIALGKGFWYVLWAPALFGLWHFRSLFRAPGPWAILLLCLILTALLYRLAQSMGYLGARHGAIVLLAGAYWTVAGLGAIGAGLARVLKRVRPEALVLALLLACTLAPASHTLATLHADRAAYRAAGTWLAKHMGPEDSVEDPYAWASYYAGWEFRPHPAHPLVCYVVLEESANDHPHLWHTMARAKELANSGEVVERFPVKRRRKPGEVLVYRVVMPKS